MPLYIQGRVVLPPFFKVELLSGIFSAIAYGIVIVLSGNCFYLLLKKRGIYPNRMRILLLIYVMVMLLNSTWKQIGSICILMANLSSLKYMTNPFFYRSFELPLIMTMWGADGFMVRIVILHQEYRLTMKLQIWRCLVLYQQVSKGLRVGITVLLSLLSFASFGKPISISSPPFKSLIKILSLRCHGISQWNDIRVRARICCAGVHFSLCSHKYYTRSVDHFPTCLLSKTRPRCPWSTTWISLHQRYHHVRRIFSTNGCCRWPVHYSVFRAIVAGWSKNHVRHHHSYLRMWFKTRWFLMHV